jgi:6-phosphofructokinase
MAAMNDNQLTGTHVNVAMMTSGGLAPCLSSSISRLSHFWIKALKDGKIGSLTLRMYKDGYKGVLIGDSFIVPEGDWESMEALDYIGGSPIGNSRVKVRFSELFLVSLTNQNDELFSLFPRPTFLS